jgi:Glycosyltransferases involved in cell wall biogenesis
MSESLVQIQNEKTRRDIFSLLSAVDAELARPVFDAPEEAIKQLLLEPPFLGRGGSSELSAPLVSIVLPTRDRGGSIADAILSVQAQSFSNWELIIVDDGSRDDTSNTVATFLADERLRYVPQEPSGHAAARNVALRMSRGALTAYIDSDDVWYPHFLDAAVVAFAALPEVDCVYGALVTKAHPNSKGILFDDFDRVRLLLGNFIDLNTVVHRRSLTEIYGGFDEALDRLVDWDLLLRFTQDKPAQRVPVLAAHYRVVDDQRVSVTRPFEPNHSAIRRKWMASGPEEAQAVKAQLSRET